MEIRSFISVDIEEPVLIGKIVRLQDSLKDLGINAKFVEPQNLHYTLKFLGNVSEVKIEEIKEVLSKISLDSFEVEIGGMGSFPSLRRINVIWLGAKKGGDKLVELAKQVDEALLKLNFPKEKRPFTPHLTICRIKTSRNKEALVKFLMSNQDIEIGSLLVNEFRLKKSTLTPKGPIYETLASFKLNEVK
ncbi:MAG: RNA 2',3'-cyclic phosphodiesterase [Candidatus Asgardarchaeia archaeon]